MESLWNLEDKFNLSTQEAIIFFTGTVFLVVVVVGICVVTVFKKRATKKIHVSVVDPGEVKTGQWLKVVRWSKASKWEGSLSASRKEQPTPLLARGGGEVGWPSHNAASPVWQRPILMGEKCEMPKFSGLILYDESGKPIDPSQSVDIHIQVCRFVFHSQVKTSYYV